MKIVVLTLTHEVLRPAIKKRIGSGKFQTLIGYLPSPLKRKDIHESYMKKIGYVFFRSFSKGQPLNTRKQIKEAPKKFNSRLTAIRFAHNDKGSKFGVAKGIESGQVDLKGCQIWSGYAWEASLCTQKEWGRQKGNQKTLPFNSESPPPKTLTLAVADRQVTAAVKVLSSSGVTPYCDDTIKALEAKYPYKPPPSMPSITFSEPHLIAEIDSVFSCIKSFPKGNSCGRDGLKAQHILDALYGEGSATATNLLKFVASAPLTPLLKPDNGIRPIAVGTIWRRFVSKVSMKGTMARVDVDTLTMEQYLALSRENQAPGVGKPKIRGNVNFKVKSQFMRELREDTFSGNKDEDAYDHIDRVLSIIGLFNILGVSKDAVMLRVFPLVLETSHAVEKRCT
ncbi:hypothetical protein Tco_0657205 [Tanacetum coccineum]|uniref:Uncharacterized protein n=1 Tax=Tanacetum coccineum TaxID=301880 RepID=A0ABQ4XB44_9ASTR